MNKLRLLISQQMMVQKWMSLIGNVSMLDSYQYKHHFQFSVPIMENIEKK